MRLIYKGAGGIAQLEEYLNQEERFLVVFRGSPDLYIEDICLVLEDFFESHKDEASLHIINEDLRTRRSNDLLGLYLYPNVKRGDAGNLAYFNPPVRIVLRPYLDSLLSKIPKILYLD